MNEGILGSGEVGLMLAEGFVTTGHAVKVGSRSPEKIARPQERKAKCLQAAFQTLRRLEKLFW
ncbi:MAG TPA: NAD(P)-binding domain-containing protein [Nitrososphaera sp.]|nr:NAD(P)-binding domain-containing protein [Nitrososphaera sp.]